MNSLTSALAPFLFRIALVCCCIIVAGVAWDMQWHGLYPIRDHYFIAPHVVVYVGITGLLGCAALLRILGHHVPLLVFALFPLLSLFDEFWHRTFGIELASSPMMFWSPAHWPFGLILLYIIYRLYTTHVETNETVLLYVQTLLYSVMPLRFIWYLLYPLTAYSQYTFLHGWWSPLITVFLPLTFITAHSLHKNQTISLVSACILAGMSGPYSMYLLGGDMIYNVPAMYMLLFLPLALSLSGEMSEYVLYHIWAPLTVTYMYLLSYLSTGSVSLTSWILLVACSILLAGFYSFLVPRTIRITQQFIKKVYAPRT